MSSNNDYIPPKVWKWERPRAGEEWRYSGINRPIAGPTHEAELPVGKHPLQLYSRGTPNGVKVTVMLEELLALGHSGAEYDAWLININGGDQFRGGGRLPKIHPHVEWTRGAEAETASRIVELR